MFPGDIVRRLLRLTTILFMNEEEAKHILAVAGAEDIKDLFGNEKLKEVVVTEGERGSTLYTSSGEVWRVGITPAQENHLHRCNSSSPRYMRENHYAI